MAVGIDIVVAKRQAKVRSVTSMDFLRASGIFQVLCHLEDIDTEWEKEIYATSNHQRLRINTMTKTGSYHVAKLAPRGKRPLSGDMALLIHSYR